MARLRELGEPCQGPEPGLDCPGGRRAVVELVDRRNAARGRYCRECGRRRLAALEEVETFRPAERLPEAEEERRAELADPLTDQEVRDFLSERVDFEY